MAKSKHPENCPACNSAPNCLHRLDCDVESCAQCGRQLLSCPHNPETDEDRMPWTGEWPGVAECREFGWYAKKNPIGRWVPCGPNEPGAEPDLNRLQKEAHWDPQQRRYIKGQNDEFDDDLVEQAKKAVVAFLTENYPQVAAVEIRYDGGCGMKEVMSLTLFDSLGPGANSLTPSDKRLDDLAYTLCECLAPANFEFTRHGGSGTVWVCISDVFHRHEFGDDDQVQDND